MLSTLDDFAFLIRGFCPGNIPDLGAMLNTLDKLINLSQKNNFNTFHGIARACKDYVEQMTLEDIHDTKPVEECYVLLKSVLGYEKKGEVFGFDYSDVLELLNITSEEATPKEKTEPLKRSQQDKASGSSDFPGNLADNNDKQIQQSEAQKTDSSDLTTPEKQNMEDQMIKEPIIEEPRKISDDDLEILVDFISEARENLDSIEINLLELEQDPENKDIINDIFRPFHTIKGVSGFLSLGKINTLSHSTENFLDSARSGDFIINDAATDVILESVDILKNLIDMVEEGTQTGFLPPATGLDIDSLTDRLKKMQIALANGETMPVGEILVQKGEISACLQLLGFQGSGPR